MKEIIDQSLKLLYVAIQKKISPRQLRWFIGLDTDEIENLIRFYEENKIRATVNFTEILEKRFVIRTCGEDKNKFNEFIQVWEIDGVKKETEVFLHKIIAKGSYLDFINNVKGKRKLDEISMSISQIKILTEEIIPLEEYSFLEKIDEILFIQKYKDNSYKIVIFDVFDNHNEKNQIEIKFNRSDSFILPRLWLNKPYCNRVLFIPN